MAHQKFLSVTQKARSLGLDPKPHFRRSLNGLFAGKVIQYGNNKPKSKHKTRRSWLPNVHVKYIRSVILKKRFRLQMTTNAMRTIDKNGGLDLYLLNTRDKKIDSIAGVEIKRMIQAKLGLKAPTREQRIQHRHQVEQEEASKAKKYALAVERIKAAAAAAEAQAAHEASRATEHAPLAQ
ncbi:MAG: 50S ribosomal protein L24 [Piptocephalis tieghemiana]|nr:MAG: 50S ribosomal protein L24 [Piptocephalis tieghemiana]